MKPYKRQLYLRKKYKKLLFLKRKYRKQLYRRRRFRKRKKKKYKRQLCQKRRYRKRKKKKFRKQLCQRRRFRKKRKKNCSVKAAMELLRLHLTLNQRLKAKHLVDSLYLLKLEAIWNPVSMPILAMSGFTTILNRQG